MKKELNIFLHALIYYSRIPIPFNFQYSEELMSKAFRYFPLVGMLVAFLGALVFNFLFLFLPKPLAVIATLVTILILTGALHEDGFADFADAFGGGRGKESILRIMKDSQIGVFGTTALIFLFMTKFSALLLIPTKDLGLALVGAHASSRVFPIFIVRSLSYAREKTNKTRHLRQGVDKKSMLLATALGGLPLLLFSWSFILPYLLLSFILFTSYKYYLSKKIQGYTGDTLGALQQMAELLFYLTFIASLSI